MKLLYTVGLVICLLTSYAENTHFNQTTENKLPTTNISSGFYYASFDAIITGQNPGDTIAYTIDGSDPQTSETVIIAQTPATISIDPLNTNRPLSPAFLLRISNVINNITQSQSQTYSYIFIDRVLTQNYPGEPWSPISETVNNQIFDYAMDSTIVYHETYEDKIKPALLALPSMSVVTDNNNLIGADSGIWVNALEHGREWECMASFEIINPDGTSLVKSNCGLRIRGASSRNPGNAKHSLRLFFREEYGAKKLEYPLFGEEGADEFDHVDLRTSQNYAWSRQGDWGAHNTMNREVFSRDLQKQMGDAYTRSRYYHLYLNGMYWGIYMTQERCEADFAETYFGGDEEDYDVVKVYDVDRTLEATDGTLDVWEEVWNKTQNGFANNENYTALMGLDAEGNIDPELTKYIDAENLIDYNLIIFFTGNFDSPTNIWSKNKGLNNFYMVKNRNRKRDGFKFFQHDAEHTLFYEDVNVGSGILENRVNIGFLTNNMQMTVSNFNKFHPQYLNHKLMENSEYRQLFIDRVYKWFYKEKVLQTEKCQNLFASRSTTIENAIIAESARWGDAMVSTPRTKNDDWQKAVDVIMNEFFNARPEIVINQIKEVGWYPEFNAPEFYISSNKIESEVYKLNATQQITIDNPDNQGSIYYTTDGSDPRNFGGAVSESAMIFTKDTDLMISGTTPIKSRIKSENEWSAINKISLLKADPLVNLKITEIHYNPTGTDTIKGKDLEFIEFKNMDSVALNLSDLTIHGGINYQFNEGAIVQANEYVVIASDAIEFREYYALEPSGEYSGHLSNSGDTIIITQSDTELANIIYETNSPWPIEADGSGNSMVVNEDNSNLSPNDAAYWRASYQLNGTPFMDDFKDVEPISNSQLKENSFSVYPNPASQHINITYTTTENSKINITLLNVLGKESAILVSKRNIQAGAHAEFIDLNKYNLAPGIYILQLSVNSKTINKKMRID